MKEKFFPETKLTIKKGLKININLKSLLLKGYSLNNSIRKSLIIQVLSFSYQKNTSYINKVGSTLS